MRTNLILIVALFVLQYTWLQSKKLGRTWILKQPDIFWRTSNYLSLCFNNGSRSIPSSLTNSPLPLLCCRQVEDICLVACVWLVVGLNVNGEFFNKRTSVPGDNKMKPKGIKEPPQQIKSECWLISSVIKKMCFSISYYFIKNNSLSPEDVHLLHLRCLELSLIE